MRCLTSNLQLTWTKKFEGMWKCCQEFPTLQIGDNIVISEHFRSVLVCSNVNYSYMCCGEHSTTIIYFAQLSSQGHISEVVESYCWLA